RSQVSNGPGFAPKLVDVPRSQLSMQHVDGCLGLQIDVRTQVHLREASLAQQPHQAIVAQLLSNAISHIRTSSWKTMCHIFETFLSALAAVSAQIPFITRKTMGVCLFS